MVNFLLCVSVLIQICSATFLLKHEDCDSEKKIVDLEGSQKHSLNSKLSINCDSSFETPAYKADAYKKYEAIKEMIENWPWSKGMTSITVVLDYPPFQLLFGNYIEHVDWKALEIALKEYEGSLPKGTKSYFAKIADKKVSKDEACAANSQIMIRVFKEWKWNRLDYFKVLMRSLELANFFVHNKHFISKDLDWLEVLVKLFLPILIDHQKIVDKQKGRCHRSCSMKKCPEFDMTSTVFLIIDEKCALDFLDNSDFKKHVFLHWEAIPSKILISYIRYKRIYQVDWMPREFFTIKILKDMQKDDYFASRVIRDEWLWLILSLEEIIDSDDTSIEQAFFKILHEKASSCALSISGQHNSLSARLFPALIDSLGILYAKKHAKPDKKSDTMSRNYPFDQTFYTACQEICELFFTKLKEDLNPSFEYVAPVKLIREGVDLVYIDMQNMFGVNMEADLKDILTDFSYEIPCSNIKSLLEKKNQVDDAGNPKNLDEILLGVVHSLNYPQRLVLRRIILAQPPLYVLLWQNGRQLTDNKPLQNIILEYLLVCTFLLEHPDTRRKVKYYPDQLSSYEWLALITNYDFSNYEQLAVSPLYEAMTTLWREKSLGGAGKRIWEPIRRIAQPTMQIAQWFRKSLHDDQKLKIGTGKKDDDHKLNLLTPIHIPSAKWPPDNLAFPSNSQSIPREEGLFGYFKEWLKKPANPSVPLIEISSVDCKQRGCQLRLKSLQDFKLNNKDDNDLKREHGETTPSQSYK